MHQNALESAKIAKMQIQKRKHQNTPKSYEIRQTLTQIVASIIQAYIYLYVNPRHSAPPRERNKLKNKTNKPNQTCSGAQHVTRLPKPHVGKIDCRDGPTSVLFPTCESAPTRGDQLSPRGDENSEWNKVERLYITRARVAQWEEASS